MHFNAIVGSNSGGTGGCTGPDGTSAEAGTRYITVAQATNGQVGSICDPSFSTVMGAIGQAAFGLKVQFFLTRPADPPTVKVRVEGVACTSGWKYDAASNSVIFDEKGTCVPTPGQQVRIEYKTLCLNE